MSILNLYKCDDDADIGNQELLKSKVLTKDLSQDDYKKMESKWNMTPDEQIEKHLKYCSKDTESEAKTELKLFMAKGGVTEEDMDAVYIEGGDMGKLTIKSVEEIE